MAIVKTHPGRQPPRPKIFLGTCPKCGARYKFEEGDGVKADRGYLIRCHEVIGGKDCGADIIGEELSYRGSPP